MHKILIGLDYIQWMCSFLLTLKLNMLQAGGEEGAGTLVKGLEHLLMR